MPYNFLNNSNPILVTPETEKLTPHTWLGNNQVWDAETIQFFYNEICKINNLKLM